MSSTELYKTKDVENARFISNLVKMTNEHHPATDLDEIEYWLEFNDVGMDEEEVLQVFEELEEAGIVHIFDFQGITQQKCWDWVSSFVIYMLKENLYELEPPCK